VKLPEVQMTGLAIAGVDFLVVHPARAKIVLIKGKASEMSFSYKIT